MKDPNLLLGFEVEEWFKTFAKASQIHYQHDYSLKSVVNLLEAKMPTRLQKSRDRLYSDYPEGNEWIDTILLASNKPAIPSKTKDEFVLYLLDTVVSTDCLIEVNSNRDHTQRIAVDVTTDAREEIAKISRIRGRPEKSDRSGENRNINYGSVRKAFGIDQHLILILNRDKRLLPSYDKLLSELQSFANSPSKTNVINLANVPEQDRFINQKLPESSQQIWNRYNQELNLKDPAQRIREIATRTYQDGLERETAIEVLLKDPFFQGMESRPAQAQKLATKAIERIWPEQEQAQSAPKPKEKPKPEDWPIYASAIGHGHVIQARAKKVVAAYQEGKRLEPRDRISLKNTFSKFKKGLASIQDWSSTAQQLGKESDYLQEIADTEKAFRQGQPLSDDAKLLMKQDKNQFAYNQLSAELNQDDPRAFLVRLAANAAKAKIRPPQIKEILSLSPLMQAIQKQKGKQAGQNFTRDVIDDGLKLKKREQPPPPGQQRGPDIDRGPSRGR